MSVFFGQCYAYPTPNNGRQTIGVCQVLGDLYGVCWIADNGSRKRIKSPNLPVHATPQAAQSKLDAFAKDRKLEEVA